jgi:hypothetical protein
MSQGLGLKLYDVILLPKLGLNQRYNLEKLQKFILKRGGIPNLRSKKYVPCIPKRPQRQNRKPRWKISKSSSDFFSICDDSLVNKKLPSSPRSTAKNSTVIQQNLSREVLPVSVTPENYEKGINMWADRNLDLPKRSTACESLLRSLTHFTAPYFELSLRARYKKLYLKMALSQYSQNLGITAGNSPLTNRWFRYWLKYLTHKYPRSKSATYSFFRKPFYKKPLFLRRIPRWRLPFFEKKRRSRTLYSKKMKKKFRKKLTERVKEFQVLAKKRGPSTSRQACFWNKFPDGPVLTLSYWGNGDLTRELNKEIQLDVKRGIISKSTIFLVC